jgi:hypothetical protein
MVKRETSKDFATSAFVSGNILLQAVQIFGNFALESLILYAFLIKSISFAASSHIFVILFSQRHAN